MLRWSLVVLAAAGLVPFAAGAQGRADENGVLRSTVSHFVQLDREGASRGPEAIKLDPRPLPARWSDGPDPRILPPFPTQPLDDAPERDPKRVAEITRGVATPGTSRAVIECPKEFGTGSCHMNGALMLIQASEPVVKDGRARVFVRKLRLVPSRNQSLAESFFVVTLTRADDGWRVTEARRF
jgi:hypothetical protein